MATAESHILNRTLSAEVTPMPRPPCDLALELQRTMLCVKGDHMTDDGRGVDYSRLNKSKVFQDYVALTSQLRACDPSHLDEAERKAFFISILYYA